MPKTVRSLSLLANSHTTSSTSKYGLRASRTPTAARSAAAAVLLPSLMVKIRRAPGSIMSIAGFRASIAYTYTTCIRGGKRRQVRRQNLHLRPCLSGYLRLNGRCSCHRPAGRRVLALGAGSHSPGNTAVSLQYVISQQAQTQQPCHRQSTVINSCQQLSTVVNSLLRQHPYAYLHFARQMCNVWAIQDVLRKRTRIHRDNVLAFIGQVLQPGDECRPTGGDCGDCRAAFHSSML